MSKCPRAIPGHRDKTHVSNAPENHHGEENGPLEGAILRMPNMSFSMSDFRQSVCIYIYIYASKNTSHLHEPPETIFKLPPTSPHVYHALVRAGRAYTTQSGAPVSPAGLVLWGQGLVIEQIMICIFHMECLGSSCAHSIPHYQQANCSFQELGCRRSKRLGQQFHGVGSYP